MSQKIQTTRLKVNYGAERPLQAPFIKSMFCFYDGKIERPRGFL